MAQVDRELQRKKASVTKGKPGDFARKYLESKADHFSEISLDKLVDEARILASNSIRTGAYDAAIVSESLGEFSENAVRKAGGYLINEAFGQGRAIEADNRAPEIDHAEYSAILDHNTCETCYGLDGQEFEIDSPEYEQYTPPNADCDGGALCRCIWIYVGKAES